METLYAVVGASSALGRRLSADLFSRGLTVAATRRSEGDPIPGACLTMRCDATKAGALDEFAAECFRRCDRVSLVYLAGLSKSAYALKLEPSDWEAVVSVCLTGAFLATRAFLPAMRSAGWGRIAYAGSVVGRRSVPGTSAYSAAKEGLKGLTRAVAAENASRGITVNCLELGYMDAGLTYTIPEGVRETILAGIPAGRYGDPGNLAEAVLFLSAADYVNGSVLTIAGGL